MARLRRLPTDRYRVRPSRFALSRIDPADGGSWGDKDAAGPWLDRLNDELELLQERLWSRQRERLLVVLQGMDTSGKDGVIRHVFDGVNPVGVRVASFKAPSAEELAHDFLWRIHARCRAAGEIVIFNRSHYEDVLVVRVRELVPERVWRARYRQINEFERLLADSGTTILKFFLHISKEEQKQRLAGAARRSRRSTGSSIPATSRSARAGTTTRRRTPRRCGAPRPPHAPWYVVPSDRKWFRNLVIAQVLVDTLKSLDLEPPAPRFDPAKFRIR